VFRNILGPNRLNHDLFLGIAVCSSREQVVVRFNLGAFHDLSKSMLIGKVKRAPSAPQLLAIVAVLVVTTIIDHTNHIGHLFELWLFFFGLGLQESRHAELELVFK
jgi:hypothetical protein